MDFRNELLLHNNCQNKKIFLTGELQKKSNKFLVGWQKRYFELNNQILKYWKSMEDYQKQKHP